MATRMKDPVPARWLSRENQLCYQRNKIIHVINSEWLSYGAVVKSTYLPSIYERPWVQSTAERETEKLTE